MLRRFLGFSFFLRTVVLVALLVIGLSLHPHPIQAEPGTVAPVVLDGEKIFQVSDSGQFSAEERAQSINLQLKEAVLSDKKIEVKVEERNELPTITLDDRYLLTVTAKDALLGSNPNEQASIWARQIQQALDRGQAERSVQYIRNTSILAAGILLGTFVLSSLLGALKKNSWQILRDKLNVTSASSSGSDPSRGLALLLELILLLARTGLWIVSLLYITNLFPYTRQWSYQIANILSSSFTTPFLTLGKNSYSLINLMILGSLLFALVIFAGSITNILQSRVLSLARINRGAQEAIAILTKYSLIVIGSLVLLQVWGLDLSSVTILASALGIGIGFGLQDIAKNIGSGLVLVFERPIQVGDFIEVGELHGTVERIGTRSTEIRTLDHISIIVPNSRFLESEIINWSHRNPISRLHLPVGVAYSSDPQSVRSALLKATTKHPNILDTPPPQVFFKGFGDSALNFELLVWTAEPHKQFLTKSDLYFRIYEILRDREIEIPFPQRDLHVRSLNLDLGVSPDLESALLNMSGRSSSQNEEHPNGERKSSKKRDDLKSG